MDVRLWQETVLYKRRIYHYKEKYYPNGVDQSTIASVLELTTLIPESLVSDARVKLTAFITIQNNFDNIIDYLNWLDSLWVTVKHQEYFTPEQHKALIEHRELSLESFLTNSSGMLYYPFVIIENIRSKLMKLDNEIRKCNDLDLRDYYERRVRGFITVISQPVFAIGELAGLRNE